MIMGTLIFVIGCIAFLSLGVFVVYWIFDELSPEDCFFRCLISIYAMSLLILLYYMFGENIFGALTQQWIIVISSIVLTIFMILYIIFYCLMDEWEFKLLLLIPSFALQVYMIVRMNIFASFIDNKYLMAILIPVIMSLITSFVSWYYKNKTREIEAIHTRYIRSHSDLPFELYSKKLDISGNVSNDISYLIIKIYHLAQEGRLSPSRLNEFLSSHDDTISPSVKSRIMERFLESPYLNNAESMNLLEFATLLFPEFYGSYTKTYRSEKYDLRIFDEFYSLMQRNMNKERENFARLDEKIEKVIQIIDNNSSKNNDDILTRLEENSTDGENHIQSILKEIHHLTKTPLQTIKYAVNNLSNSKENELSDTQKEKIATILNNVLTVKLIIEAYKKLAIYSDVATNEDIIPYLKTAITSLGGSKNIQGKFMNFPNEKICVHGNNVVAILLLPLIHNAIEASPENGEIIVSCNEKNDNYTISIENQCVVLPKPEDLNKDGFSTRTDAKGGVGLMSVRRISSSIGIKFDISVYNKTNKVVARLTIPKK